MKTHPYNHTARTRKQWRKRLIGATFGISLGWLVAGYAPTFSDTGFLPTSRPASSPEQPEEAKPKAETATELETEGEADAVNGE